MEEFRPVWLKYLQPYGADPVLAGTIFSDLESRYSEPGRYYHNGVHIGALLREWERCRGKLEDPEAVFVAILFHDAVYDAQRKDNEELSALLALSCLEQLQYPVEKAQHIAGWIRATQDHVAGEEQDLCYLLDMDLRILGSEPGVYEQYIRQIRREYAVYPDDLYRPGRKKALQHFLERPYIYATSFFREQFEAQARRNIGAEIASL